MHGYYSLITNLILMSIQSYLVPVTLSGKTFQMVLDTGSSDFWVFSNLMPKVQSKGHLTYNVTSKNLMKGQTFGVHYGDGSSAGGPVYADKVAIGGVTVTAQAVEAATSASSLFVGETAADGLMGMAFIGLNTVRPTPQKSFFTNAMPSLASKLFAVTLRHQLPGSFDLGFINSTKYTGKLNYINVVNMNPSTSATFWQFNLRKYVVGKSSIDTGSNYPSIVDTATSLMYLPAPVVTAYYKSVKGAAVDPTWAAYTFPCNSSLPNIGVVINGVTYYVKAPLLNWERINGTHCLGGLQSSANLRFNVLGAVFLKSVYAVFDQTQATPRVGFAAQSGK